MRIAVLEDSPTDSLMMTSLLRTEGHEVYAFSRVRELRRFCMVESVDLLLLDWVLPDESGESFLKWLRTDRQDDTPAIFITALDSDEHIVQGLGAGADDFMIKPISAPVLYSRIEALMRRSRPREAKLSLEFLPYRIDVEQAQISLHGKTIDLTVKELDLALFMFRNVGRLLSRGHMLEAVWARSADIPTRTVDTHVSRVRRKLSLQPENGFRLITTYNYGYRLERLGSNGSESGKDS